MSNHITEVVEIRSVRPHPNADRMEITEVMGWQCCIGKGQFKPGDLAVYVEPDFVVPLAHESFAFLRKPGSTRTHERITVRRFRGEISQGLLIPLPASLAGRMAGDNVIDDLGIVRYEPTQHVSTGGDDVSSPSGLYAPKFDVDNWQRYKHLLISGEAVYITEKIHGANARYTFAKDPGTGEAVQFCGSRTNWKAESESNAWWKAFRDNPGIGTWCKENPGKILYGEVYGNVQSLRYGVNGVKFIAFAILDGQVWMNTADAMRSLALFGVPFVPVRYSGPLPDDQAIREMAEMDSAMPGANHLSEGVVIVPAVERMDSRLGRVAVKVVSNRYLES